MCDVGMNMIHVVSSASACVPSLYLCRISSDDKLHLANNVADVYVHGSASKAGLSSINSTDRFLSSDKKCTKKR